MKLFYICHDKSANISQKIIPFSFNAMDNKIVPLKFDLSNSRHCT